MLMPMMKITYHETTYKQYGIDHRYVLIKMIITFTRHQQFSNMVMNDNNGCRCGWRKTTYEFSQGKSYSFPYCVIGML